MLSRRLRALGIPRKTCLSREPSGVTKRVRRESCCQDIPGDMPLSLVIVHYYLPAPTTEPGSWSVTPAGKETEIA